MSDPHREEGDGHRPDGRDQAPLRSLDYQVVEDVEVVRRLRAEVRGILLGHGMLTKAVDGVELGLDEVLMNALEHGRDQNGNVVELHIELYPDRVDFEVRDRGETHLGDEASEASLPDGDAESGRGLFLIQHTMDEVSFHAREGGGTLVRMTKHLGSAPDAP